MKKLALWSTLAVFVSMLVSPSVAQAAPPPLPGGKRNWVVSVGGLNNANDPRNWVRLGYYAFKDDGTVETNFWSWSEADNPERVDTVKANCDGTVPHCYVRTVEGFAGDPTGGFRGTFAYDTSGRLVVTWKTDRDGNDIADLRETWNVETGLVGGDLARITSPTYYTNSGSPANPDAPDPELGVFSSYSATFGIGYGSNAELDNNSRVSLDKLMSQPEYNSVRHRGTFIRVNGGLLDREWAGGNFTFSGAQGDNNANPWQKCAGAECLGFVQHGTSCSDAANPDNDRARYIAQVGGGRRNTEEYWCMLLAGGKDCYIHNSHPRPMLQIIDDHGKFHGWVGAEAFSHVDTMTNKPTSQWSRYYWGIFDTVSPPLQGRLPADEWAGRQATPNFTLPDGANQASGDLAWNEKALQFGGRNYVENGCHYVELLATGKDGSRQRGTSSPLCPGLEDDRTRPFVGSLAFPQGAASVVVTYWSSTDGGDTYTPRSAVNCTKDGCESVARRPFRLAYGNSVATGTLTWVGPSILFEGNNHVASGCRLVEIVATGADGSTRAGSSSKLCTAGDRTFGPQLIDMSGAGGTTSVQITYKIAPDNQTTPQPGPTVTCTRNGC